MVKKYIEGDISGIYFTFLETRYDHRYHDNRPFYINVTVGKKRFTNHRVAIILKKHMWALR